MGLISEQNEALVTSILYILITLAGFPLAILLVWLFCKLYASQVERIRFRRRMRAMEEGKITNGHGQGTVAVVSTTATPGTPSPDPDSSGAVGSSTATIFDTAAENGDINNNNENENGNGEESTATLEQSKYQISEEMKRWKQERDLFVQRGGQGDLAEVLRSQSRAGGAYSEEQEVNEPVYKREYSPPPRIPTL
ncbi:hypothetical protein TWF730_010080 [Orbilia blumenaviensis]|uniref:Uncharacterized protein n=1 Tax=Orbilia blumenaviensis TaxID=1796055 RepID=A0AAV9UWN5_9PEZI